MTLRTYSLPVYLIGYLIGLCIIAGIASIVTAKIIATDIRSDVALICIAVIGLLLPFPMAIA